MNVVVYSKEGCHLCENVITILERINSEHAFEVTTRDISTNPELFARYKDLIPVVEVDGRVRLGGAALSNLTTLEDVLRRALSSASS